MNRCGISVLILLFTISILYKIRFIDGKPTASTSDFSMSSISKALTEASDADAHTFLWRWNRLNATIDEFIHNYQSLHQVGIRINRFLKPVESDFGTTQKGLCREYLLEFFTEDRESHSSVIVMIPELGYLYDETHGSKLYDKEKYVYERVLPQMYQSRQLFSPSPIFYASGDSGILILENTHDVYVTKYLTEHSLEECHLVLKTLAQFHALSIANLDEDVYDKLSSLTATEVITKIAIDSLDVMDYKLLIFSSLTPDMKDKIALMIPEFQSIVESVYSRSNGFNVVLQGNLNRRHIRFRLDESGTATKCKFVNFRFSRQGSPVLDLMPYLISSIEFEDFKKHGDSLLSFYLEELHRNLKELNLSFEYDLNTIHEEIRYYKSHFIYQLMYHIPFVVTDQIPENIHETEHNALLSDKFLLYMNNWMKALLDW